MVRGGETPATRVGPAFPRWADAVQGAGLGVREPLGLSGTRRHQGPGRRPVARGLLDGLMSHRRGLAPCQ